MGCFNGCRKWVVFFFNIFFLLIGCILIIFGTLHEVRFGEATEALPPSYSYLGGVPLIVIVLGSTISIFSIIGLCGVCRKNSFLLTGLSLVLLTIFVLEIGTSIFIFVEISNKDDLEINVNKTLDSVFHKDSAQDRELIDFIQNKFDCCGTYGPNYWRENVVLIPKSCYIEEESVKVLHQNGCQKEFYNFLLESIRFCGITILALSVFQVIGATFTFSLANHIRNNDRRYGRYIK